MKGVSIVLAALVMLAGVSEAEATLVNVAFGKPASTNSVYSTNGPERAVDGDLATAWIALGHGSPLTPYWLQVDLESSYMPERIVLSSADGTFPESYYIDYVLESSTDGSAWSLIQTGTLYDGPTAPLDYVDEITLPGTDAMRYVKFTVNGGTHWAHLNEIEVWDDVMIPEPSTIAIWSLIGLSFIGIGRLRRRHR